MYELVRKLDTCVKYIKKCVNYYGLMYEKKYWGKDKTEKQREYLKRLKQDKIKNCCVICGKEKQSSKKMCRDCYLKQASEININKNKS